MMTPAFPGAAGAPTRGGGTAVTFQEGQGNRTTVGMAAQPARRPPRFLPAPRGVAGPPPRYLARQAETFWFERIAEPAAVYCQINRIAGGPGESLAESARRLLAELTSHETRF